jgi:hypothetical protein
MVGSGVVMPVDTGMVHPSARIIPHNKKTKTTVLRLISTGFPAGTQILSG